ALVVGLAFGGVALFRRSPSTLASSVPKTSEVPVAKPRTTDHSDALSPTPIKTEFSTSATESNASAGSAQALSQLGNQRSILASDRSDGAAGGTSTKGPNAASPADVLHPGSETAKAANSPGEVAPRRAIAANTLAKPIAKAGRPAISNAGGSAPALDVQE